MQLLIYGAGKLSIDARLKNEWKLLLAVYKFQFKPFVTR